MVVLQTGALLSWWVMEVLGLLKHVLVLRSLNILETEQDGEVTTAIVVVGTLQVVAVTFPTILHAPQIHKIAYETYALGLSPKDSGREAPKSLQYCQCVK
jgi:hypothetical protein